MRKQDGVKWSGFALGAFLAGFLAMPLQASSPQTAPAKASPAVGAASVGLLRQGDRVVLLGDSITEFGKYSDAVEAYVSLRHPDLQLEWINAGWAGDNTGEAFYRLERDVLALRPTLVTICLGMNDGYYMKRDADVAGLYASNLDKLVARLQAAGLRVVLLTPGVVDEQGPRNAWMKDVGYNAGMLADLAARCRDVAARRGVPCVDLHALMGKVVAEARKRDGNFQFAPDGIHPDEGGGLVMAYALLKALGLPTPPGELELDLQARALRGSAARALAWKSLPGGGAAVRLRLAGLPYAVPAKARGVLPYLPFQSEFNPFLLKVRGLSGPAALELDGLPGAFLPPAALAAGLGLEDLPEAGLPERIRDLQVFCAEKNKAYIQMWRNLALKPNYLQREASYRRDLHRLALSDNSLLQAKLRSMVRAARGVELAVIPLPAGPQRLVDGSRLRLFSFSPMLPGWRREPEKAPSAAKLAALGLRWFPHLVAVERREDNLDFWRGAKGSAGYAALRLDSAAAQTANLQLQAGDAVEVWLNGRALSEGAEKKKARGGGSRDLALELLRGENLLLLRVPQKEVGAGLSAALKGLQAPLDALLPLPWRDPGL